MMCSSVAAQTNKWTNFSSEKGKFSVSLPAEPTFEESNGEMQPTDMITGKPIGKKIRYTSNLFSAADEQKAFYIVCWVDYEPGFSFNTDGELKANKDSFISTLGATLISEKTMKFDGYPAIEFTAEKSPNAFVKGRVIIVGKKPFVLVGVTLDKNNTAGIENFLTSFKLTKKQ